MSSWSDMDRHVNYGNNKITQYVLIVTFLVAHLPAPGRLEPQEGNGPSYQNETPSGISYTVAASFNTSSHGQPLGQVTGIAMNLKGNLVIFHRGNHRWDDRSFDETNHYRLRNEGPIKEETVIEFNTDSMSHIKSWGSNLFFLPHGLTVDHEGSFWLTDVALHQILKFKEGDLKTASLTLGERFVPGSDHRHFCKPTSVAVDSKSGNFFVSDGYCNSRVMMFDSKGKYIKEWGEEPVSLSFHFHQPPQSPLELYVPHKIVLLQEFPSPVVSIADRENGRVQCLDINSGKVIQSISGENALNVPSFNGKVYSVSFASSCGLMFLVSGLTNNELPILAFAVEHESNKLVATFAPPDAKHGISVSISNLCQEILSNQRNVYSQFTNSHDIVSTPDCNAVYVSEIGPNVVWKFVRKDSTGQPSSLHKDSISSSSTLVMISFMSLVIAVLGVFSCIYRRRNTDSFSSSSHYSSNTDSVNFLSRLLPERSR